MPGDLIHTKMAAVMRQIKSVPKAGWNPTQKFAFRSIDDTVEVVHNAMVAHEIFMTPNVIGVNRWTWETSKGSVMHAAEVTMEFTFFAEDGSFVICTMAGEASDSGDKATSKAESMALKYALFHTFMIPTGEADPDSEVASEEMVVDPNALTPGDKANLAVLGQSVGLERDALRAAIAEAVGREIATTSDLTKADLSVIETAFNDMRNEMAGASA